MRLLSAIACEFDLDVCHFDVEQAFVQSKLDEDVFMRLPRGCGRLSGKVVRLNKSVYGLKQASRSWHAHLTTCLKTLGFQQCLADACVFRLVEEGRVAIIVQFGLNKSLFYIKVTESYLNICIVTRIARVRIDLVRLPILLVVS